MFKYILIFFSCFLFLPFAVRAEVPAVEVSPMVIDGEAKGRDILEYEIKIKNNSKPYKATFYLTARDIITTGEGQTSQDFSMEADRSAHLSRWMEFTRGMIGLMPGEEQTIPVKIKVESYAVPAMYHTELIFAEGANRPEAEENAKNTLQPKVTFNILVKDNIVERAEIKTYKPAQDFFIALPARINLELKNIGNSDLIPHGNLFIYNRRGQELAKIDVNDKGVAVKPNESGDFSVDWSAPGAFGMYKAKLELDYGTVDKRNLQDTVYFWVLPWKFLAVFGAGIIALFTILLVMNQRRKQYQMLPAVESEHSLAVVDDEAAGIINLRRK